MDLGEFLGGIGTVDLLIVLYFIGFFVLGFAQGTIRRLIGIGSILFSFLFAANLADPLGRFLGDNWTQFPQAVQLHDRLRHGLRRPRRSPSRWSSRATTSRSSCSRRRASPTRSSAASSACSRRRSSSAPC